MIYRKVINANEYMHNQLVGVYSNVNDKSIIANDSKLIIPAGIKAYVAINGELEVWNNGRYDLETGVSSFFNGIRYFMTQGDPGVGVSIFFVDPNRFKVMTFGTGDFTFHENRFNLTMQARSAGSAVIRISDPERVVRSILGISRTSVSEDDIEPFFKHAVISQTKQILSKTVSGYAVSDFNTVLENISSAVQAKVSASLKDFGIFLKSIQIESINVDPEDKKSLSNLENSYAEGILNNDIQLDNLNRVWRGNLEMKMVGDSLTGRNGNSSGSGSSDAFDTLIKAEVLNKMMSDPDSFLGRFFKGNKQ